MQHTTTIEINEVETEVTIEFTAKFGEIEIEQMTDVDGNSIAPDLLGETNTSFLIDELHEVAGGFEQIELENHLNY